MTVAPDPLVSVLAERIRYLERRLHMTQEKVRRAQRRADLWKHRWERAKGRA